MTIEDERNREYSLEVLSIIKESRTFNCAVRKEIHLIINGIGVQFHYPNENPDNPMVWRAVEPTPNIAKRVHEVCPQYAWELSHYRSVINPEHSLIVSSIDVYPYIEGKDMPKYTPDGGCGWRRNEQVMPRINLDPMFGESYTRKIWWQVIQQKEVKRLAESLHKKGFHKYWAAPKDGIERYSYQNTLFLEGAVNHITCLLNQIAVYHRIKYYCLAEFSYEGPFREGTRERGY